MKNEALEKAIDLIEGKIEELKAEIRPLFNGNSAYEYVANQIRYNNKLLSLLKECDSNPVADTKGGLHLAGVNARYLQQMIKAIKEMNPYPSDVFLEPAEDDWNGIGKFLHEHGKNPDRIFAKWGRMVWENCAGTMEDFLP